jgi:hypothetical protein
LVYHKAVVDYLNQGLPSIQQPYRPGYDKNYGPGEGTYTTVMPKPGYEYVYGPDGKDIQFLYQDMIQL